MDTALTTLMRIAEETLTFDYQIGNVTRVQPHSTGWRQLPSLVVCELDYPTRIEAPGKVPVLSKAGDAICLPPGVEHRVTMISRTPGVSRWSHTSYRILGSVDIFSLLRPPTIIQGKTARRIGRINETLAQYAEHGPSGLSDVFRHKLLGIELLVCVTEGAELVQGGLQLLHGARNLAPVLAYISGNLGGNLGRDVLARIAHLSPSRFHTVFDRALGRAPGQYVQELRLHRAQQLLISSDSGVEEIGQKVGYSDPFHFSRLFKKRCRMSPKAYRQQARLGIVY